MTTCWSPAHRAVWVRPWPTSRLQISSVGADWFIEALRSEGRGAPFTGIDQRREANTMRSEPQPLADFQRWG